MPFFRMTHLYEFTTQRLWLRQWQPRDFAPFAELNADPTVMAHFPNTLDRATSDQLAQRQQDAIATRGWGLWAVEHRESHDFIGFVGLNPPHPALGLGAEAVEIAWRLALPFWGQGYATEAAQACLFVGFTWLKFPAILSFTALTNARSQAVMERLRMRRDRETFLHPLLPAEHPLAPHCLYRLAHHEWARQQGTTPAPPPVSSVHPSGG